KVAGAKKAAAPTPEYTPTQMLRSAPFWVLFVMFVLTATGGLIVTAQLKPVAKDFGIASAQASLFGLTVMALPFTLAVSRVLNGVSRPFFGWISDHIGRENTMFLAFTVEGVSVLLLSQFGRNPAAFVVL